MRAVFLAVALVASVPAAAGSSAPPAPGASVAFPGDRECADVRASLPVKYPARPLVVVCRGENGSRATWRCNPVDPRAARLAPGPVPVPVEVSAATCALPW